MPTGTMNVQTEGDDALQRIVITYECDSAVVDCWLDFPLFGVLNAYESATLEAGSASLQIQLFDEYGTDVLFGQLLSLDESVNAVDEIYASLSTYGFRPVAVAGPHRLRIDSTTSDLRGELVIVYEPDSYESRFNLNLANR